MQTGLTRTELLAYYKVIQGPSNRLLGRGVELREPAQYYRTEVAPGLPHIIIPNRQDSTERLVFLLQVQEGRYDAGLDLRCL
jgi:hypothetical protein